MKHLKIISFLVFTSFLSFNGFSQSDNCVTATVVTLDATGNACVSGTTINATSANVSYGTCNPSPDVNNEVWYTFVTNGANNVFDVIPQGLTNPEIVIYTGGCNGTLQTCNNLTGTGNLNTTIGLASGIQVWIGIMSNQGTEGNFDFCVNSTVPPPTAGNGCSGAIPLCDKNTPISVDMTTITPSGDQPDCFGAVMNNDVWLTFTATQSGTLEFQATPTGAGSATVELDWALYNTTSGCPTNLTGSGGDPSMTCNYNYDGANGNPAGMTNPAGGEFSAPVNIVAGQTYTIVMDYYTGGGTGTMDFQFLSGMTAEIAPVSDFTINPTGPTCAASVNVTITDNSLGVPTYDFGDGSATYTGNSPPVHTYTTPGTYAITASIGGACPSTHTEFVQLFGPVVPVATPVVETCAGDCDGSISIATTGGSGNYTYAWNPPAGQTAPVITGLCANNYSVTVTDAVCGNVVLPVVLAAGPVCVTCAMDSMSVTMTNCYNTPSLQYDVAGTVYYSNPPTTGTLTITDCNGGSQVFNAPFGASQTFTFTGLPQTGSNCAFTAVFSADPACTITTNFLSPPPITAFTVNQGSCVNNTFNLNGTISFNNPPATGTLTISYDNGTTTIDTIINAPFTSPENWSITAPSNGANYIITAYFSGFPTCTNISTGTAPPSCGCVADVGTFTAGITGSGTTPYKLCFGDQFTLTSNGDNVNPDIANAPPIPAPYGYNPGLGYLIYSCPPTIATTPSNIFPNDDINNDPCFVGVVGFGNNFNDVNFLGAPTYAGAWTNNTIYYVPITFYDTLSGTYSYTNTGTPCYEMGAPFAVQYLTQITSSSVPDCQDSSVTITISGGLPEADGSLYTASNLLPTTASFVNTTTTHNGTIKINGLQDGDMYSFDIIDTNGCPITITGGPFIGLPNANAGADDTVCVLNYNLNAIPSVGTGTWSGPAGVIFSAANSPTSTVTVPTSGSYTFTWTEDNTGGCISTDNVTVLFNILSIPAVVTDVKCNAGNDGQIILAPQGGIAPYTYQWNAAANNQVTNPATNLSAGSFTVTVTDGFGCFLDSTFTVNEPLPFSYTTTSISSNCGNADGSATVVGFSGGSPNYTYDWGAGPVASNTLNNLTPGTYTVTVADANLCDTTFDIVVANAPGFTASMTSFTDATCNGAADGTATADGSDPLVTYNYNWFNAGNQTTQTATGLAAGTYDVELTDPNTNCVDTVSVTITEPTLVIINTITPTTTICIGQNTNISATATGGSGAGYIYTWDNALGAGQVQNVSPTSTTTYIVTAVDGNGCPSAPDTVLVTVNPPLTVVASADISICPNGQANISANGNGGNGGPYTYSWNNGVGSGQNLFVNPGVTTTYIVTLSDGCSPDVFDTVIISINPLPIVDFVADTLSICETPGQPFEFYNTTDTTGGMVSSSSWDFGDGSSGFGDTISHSYSSPGFYDITLTVTSNANAGGCSASLTKFNYVQVFANPVASFISNSSEATMFDPTINFTDQSYSNIQFWSWNFGGLDTSNIQHPSYTFPEDTGTYLISLNVIDGNGCTNSTQNIVTIKGEFGLYVPNAFSPDGDALNDGFAPHGFGISDADYSFFIFDRWGELIFETHTKFDPWDATYKNKIVQNGVYVWKLYFKDINGTKHSKTGRVSLIK